MELNAAFYLTTDVILYYFPKLGLNVEKLNYNHIIAGQSDIKKLKRENEQLKREISALRYEYDRLDRMLRERRSSPEHSDVCYLLYLYFLNTNKH